MRVPRLLRSLPPRASAALPRPVRPLRVLAAALSAAARSCSCAFRSCSPFFGACAAGLLVEALRCRCCASAIVAPAGLVADISFECRDGTPACVASVQARSSGYLVRLRLLARPAFCAATRAVVFRCAAGLLVKCGDALLRLGNAGARRIGCGHRISNAAIAVGLRLPPPHGAFVRRGAFGDAAALPQARQRRRSGCRSAAGLPEAAPAARSRSRAACIDQPRDAEPP